MATPTGRYIAIEASMPAAHPAHQKWRSPQKALLKSISRHHVIQAREAGGIVKETFGVPFTDQDIRNARARIRIEELDGYTPIHSGSD